jgi:hypothetical protein
MKTYSFLLFSKVGYYRVDVKLYAEHTFYWYSGSM